jgi:hypothetical protein
LQLIALLAALVQIFGGCATSAKLNPDSPVPSARADPCDPSSMKPPDVNMTGKEAGFALLGLPLAPIWAVADLPQALHQGTNPPAQASPETWSEACRPCVQLANEALAKYPSEKWRYQGCECIELDAGRPYVDPAPPSSAWAHVVPVRESAPDNLPLSLGCRSNSNVIRVFPTGGVPENADDECRRRFRATCYDALH